MVIFKQPDFATEQRNASPMPTEAPETVPFAQQRTPKPSLAEIFHEEEGGLLRFAVGLTSRRELAEELVQEGFLRLQEHWDSVENPRAWLYRCIRNLAMNHHRDHARECQAGEDEDSSDPGPLPSEILSRLEVCGHLRMLIAELPVRDRELLALKYQEHLGYAEISRRTGLGIGNVGYRLHHLLKTLGGSLREIGINSAEG